MEFLLVFALSFLILLGVALALTLGRPPSYRPSRSEILALLVSVMEKRASIAEWEMFLSLPINHDPALENIRQQCLLLIEGNGDQPPAGEGLDGAILDKGGMERLRAIAAGLHRLLESEPGSRLF